jgi:hypothetical protein
VEAARIGFATVASPDDEPIMLRLERWDGPVDPDSEHANFLEEVALWSHTDPMETLLPFAEMVGLPVGVVARFVLARWAAEGSSSFLELGPAALDRLWEVCESAEAAGSDEGRLAGYRKVREIIGWMRTAPQ